MTTEQLLITGIGMLGTAIVSVWGSYLYLQATKDKEIQDERTKKDQEIQAERKRTDELIEKAVARSDSLLLQQKDQIKEFYSELIARNDRENRDLMFVTVSQYERLFKLLERDHGISKERLIEETKKTKRIDKFSQSEVKEISSDMLRQLREEKKDGNT